MDINVQIPMAAVSQKSLPRIQDLRSTLAPYSRASTPVALRQMLTTLLLYGLGWAAMFLSLRVGYWLTLLLAVPTAGMMVRIFIFFHDCGHNSFLPSTRWNRILGFWLGVLVFTPGEQWWRAHAIHHATSSNLDKRGTGDVTTLTVAEYRRLSGWGKLGYRLFRHPLVMFGLGPFWMFLIQHRLPLPRLGKKETLSVIYANLAITALAAGISALIGFQNYILIQLPVLWLGGMAGIWMFYIQHQFDSVYWAPDEEWSYLASAFEGASYYRLPRVLQWFTGNIGFHHIHHFSPLVPNYQLDRAYASSEIFRHVATFSIRQSLQMVNLTLIDEKNDYQLVSFKEAAKLPA